METVSLTKEDAELFKLFRQHQKVFMVMLDHGSFSIPTGSVTMHFMNSNLQQIVTQQISYKRKAVATEGY